MDYASIVKDINIRMSHYGGSVCATKDEVAICWLVAEVERLRAAQEPGVQGDCRHRWVSAKNEVIESGEYCPKCNAIRATP